VEGSCEQGNEPWGFHKMLGISCVTAQLAVSQEGLSSMNECSKSLVTTAWRVLTLRMKETVSDMEGSYE
jgi:hypothetical protein